MNLEFLKKEEQTAVALKALYKSYGYKRYKMGSFEEYSIYTENKDFLPSKNVITFGGLDGRLLALRPDVTLSIIKNVKTADGVTEKLFYDEKVYRAPVGSREYREVSQMGVEVIGEVDDVAEMEITELMLKTLAAIGGNYVLDISHMGFVGEFIDGLGLSGADRDTALTYLRNKDGHDFDTFAKEKCLDKDKCAAFKELMTLEGEPDAAIAKAKKLAFSPAMLSAVKELETVACANAHSGRVNVNFSITNNADYYNGVIFNGYVEGVPNAVLTGGRYDRLLAKFDKKAQAIGFALYLGELGRYFNEKPDMPDIALICGASAEKALAKAEKLRRSGASVLLCRRPPENFRGKICRAEDEND